MVLYSTAFPCRISASLLPPTFYCFSYSPSHYGVRGGNVRSFVVGFVRDSCAAGFWLFSQTCSSHHLPAFVLLHLLVLPAVLFWFWLDATCPACLPPARSPACCGWFRSFFSCHLPQPTYRNLMDGHPRLRLTPCLLALLLPAFTGTPTPFPTPFPACHHCGVSCLPSRTDSLLQHYTRLLSALPATPYLSAFSHGILLTCGVVGVVGGGLALAAFMVSGWWALTTFPLPPACLPAILPAPTCPLLFCHSLSLATCPLPGYPTLLFIACLYPLPPYSLPCWEELLTTHFARLLCLSILIWWTFGEAGGFGHFGHAFLPGTTDRTDFTTT